MTVLSANADRHLRQVAASVGEFYLQKFHGDWQQAVEHIRRIGFLQFQFPGKQELIATVRNPGVLIGLGGDDIEQLQDYLRGQQGISRIRIFESQGVLEDAICVPLWETAIRHEWGEIPRLVVHATAESTPPLLQAEDLIRLPDMFERQLQPEGSTLCGAAVTAMATLTPLADLLEKNDWRDFTTDLGIARYLVARGILMGPPVKLSNPLATAIYGQPAIAAIPSRRFKVDHFVFWTGREVFDPTGREHDPYELVPLATHLLCYYQDREQPELPVDWRYWLPEAAEN
jgi:hypothetical protein